MAGLWNRPFIAVALVFFALTGLRNYVIEPIKVVSVSMSPTLVEGDILLVEKITPAFAGVHPGDIVVAIDKEGSQIVKRVRAVEGQILEIYDSKVIVDEQEIIEPYLKAYNPSGLFHAPVKVPEGDVFLLGDNRIYSVDSRNYGTIPTTSIIGRVAVTVPFGNRK